MDFQSTYKQIQKNSASVSSTLGGENHGHLCLFKYTITYNIIIPDNAYVCPVQPAPLGANNKGTADQTIDNISLHNLAIANFHESNHIEHTIINQTQSALAESVFVPKINKEIGVLYCTVTDLIKYLFDSYGNISHQKLYEERIRITQHKYIHRNPIANIFNAIHK